MKVRLIYGIVGSVAAVGVGVTAYVALDRSDAPPPTPVAEAPAAPSAEPPAESSPDAPLPAAEAPERPSATDELAERMVEPADEGPPVAAATDTPVAAAPETPAAATEPAPGQAAERTPGVTVDLPAQGAVERPLAQAAESAPGQTAALTPGQPAPAAQARAPTVRQVPLQPRPGAPAAGDVIGPSFDVVRVEREGNAVIAGRAAPGAEVVVRSGETELGRVTADPNGDWVLLPEMPLAPGDRELSLVQRDAQGTETPSDKVVVLVVPERGRDVAGRASEGDTAALAVLVPRQGEGATRVLQAPEAASSAALGSGTTGTVLVPEPSTGPALTVTVEVIDYTADGRLRLAGRAPAGAGINAYLDNAFLGAGRAGDDTVWEIAPDRRVPPGLYLLRVDQLDAVGQVVARVELPFMRAEPLADLPAGSLVVVQPGNSLWRIARRVYGRGLQYTEIYAANANQIRDPDLIYPGQIFALPTTQ